MTPLVLLAILVCSKKAAISGPSYEQDTIQVTSTGGTKVYFKESDNVTLPKDVTVTDNQLPIDGGTCRIWQLHAYQTYSC